jgi:hypothetical protein
LEPLKDIDWRILMAASGGAANPSSMIAMAFRDLADNAQKIGQLNISPDLLTTLLNASEQSQGPSRLPADPSASAASGNAANRKGRDQR